LFLLAILGFELRTQGLHLEPLHQNFFVMGRFVKIKFPELFAQGWLQIMVLLISAS
jgi:hypothetical protein